MYNIVDVEIMVIELVLCVQGFFEKWVEKVCFI